MVCSVCNMNRITLFLFIFLTCANAHPLPLCREDEHCSEGYFCRTEVHMCQECLQCEDYRREPANITIECVKYAGSCGPCKQGFTMIYNSVRGQCVTLEFLERRYMYELQVWLTAAALVILVIMIFALVIKNVMFIIIMFRIE